MLTTDSSPRVATVLSHVHAASASLRIRSQDLPLLTLTTCSDFEKQHHYWQLHFNSRKVTFPRQPRLHDASHRNIIIPDNRLMLHPNPLRITQLPGP
jgi:hypothetical protein